jgi:transposase-like protein
MGWKIAQLSYRNNLRNNDSVRQCQRLFHKLGFRQRNPDRSVLKLIPKNRNLLKKTKTEN